MTEEKFVKSNKKYLDLAKEITYKLHETCVNSDEEYNLVTVLAGVAIGTYMFIKELAKATDQSTKAAIAPATELGFDFDEIFKISIFFQCIIYSFFYEFS